MRSKMPGGPTPLVPADPGILKQQSPSGQNVDQDKSSKEDVDMLGRKPNDGLPGENMLTPPEQCSSSRPTVDDGQGTSGMGDVTYNGDAPREEYTSSPLPPSSPLPASPVSSPTKHHDSDFETSTINNFLIPDSDILLPSASDSDGPQGVVDTAWLSDDACAASWFADSETSAWLTETEAWLTDTEGGGPLLTDSDGAWLSDSDAVFGDMSSLPPSSASNWLSDDADVDTDGEVGGMEGPDGGFDPAAFERTFAALVERGGRGVADKNEGGGSSTRAVESELWESLRPLLGGNDTGTATGDVDESVDANKVAQDIQKLLNGLVGT